MPPLPPTARFGKRLPSTLTQGEERVRERAKESLNNYILVLYTGTIPNTENVVKVKKDNGHSITYLPTYKQKQ
jgi:hypothetical protein